jgi:hypothetical protein
VVNLATARQLVQKHLTDRCRIERDQAGVYDDVLDMATGQLLARPLEPQVIYPAPGEEGYCLVRPTGIGQTVEGARVIERRGYAVSLPHDAPQFRRGDRVIITASDDPELVDRPLTLIDGSQGATMDTRCVLNAQDPDPVSAQ